MRVVDSNERLYSKLCENQLNTMIRRCRDNLLQEKHISCGAAVGTSIKCSMRLHYDSIHAPMVADIIEVSIHNYGISAKRR